MSPATTEPDLIALSVTVATITSTLLAVVGLIVSADFRKCVRKILHIEDKEILYRVFEDSFLKDIQSANQIVGVVGSHIQVYIDGQPVQDITVVKVEFYNPTSKIIRDALLKFHFASGFVYSSSLNSMSLLDYNCFNGYFVSNNTVELKCRLIKKYQAFYVTFIVCGYTSNSSYLDIEPKATKLKNVGTQLPYG